MFQTSTHGPAQHSCRLVASRDPSAALLVLLLLVGAPGAFFRGALAREAVTISSLLGLRGDGNARKEGGVRGPGAGGVLRDEDLVLAIGTTSGRLHLAHTSVREARNMQIFHSGYSGSSSSGASGRGGGPVRVVYVLNDSRWVGMCACACAVSGAPSPVQACQTNKTYLQQTLNLSSWTGHSVAERLQQQAEAAAAAHGGAAASRRKSKSGRSSGDSSGSSHSSSSGSGRSSSSSSSSSSETYLYWPDRPDKRLPGDGRVAMAPWLAARHVSS